MRFLADENLRADVVTTLRSQGHDVAKVASGSSDDVVALRGKKERRVILTHDADFARTLTFPPKEFSGIVVIGVHPPRYETITAALKRFLSSHTTKDLRGKTFVLHEHTFLEIQ